MRNKKSREVEWLCWYGQVGVRAKNWSCCPGLCLSQHGRLLSSGVSPGVRPWSSLPSAVPCPVECEAQGPLRLRAVWMWAVRMKFNSRWGQGGGQLNPHPSSLCFTGCPQRSSLVYTPLGPAEPHGLQTALVPWQDWRGSKGAQQSPQGQRQRTWVVLGQPWTRLSLSFPWEPSRKIA